MIREIVKRGEWLYDESVYKPAYIVKLDYDFWYEMGKADGDLEPDETPELNEEGFLYYVCFKSDPETIPGWVDSPGFKTIEKACDWAESQVPGTLSWDDDKDNDH